VTKEPPGLPCEVVTTDEFQDWWMNLPETQHDAIRDAVNLLEQFGVDLPFPHQSNVGASKYAMRELRRKSGAHQLRVFYVFDETREAVVLLGGDKLGVGDKRFYEKVVPKADALWETYCKEQGRKARRKS
jgi:hypothetical protein